MDEVLGRDIGFLYDFDMGISGEGKMVSGRNCLAQDLIHSLTTPKGSLLWHPVYGVDILRFLKMPKTIINQMALEQEIRMTVEADPRVQIGSVRVQLIDWDLNKIAFKVTCTPITEAHPLNMVFDWGAYDATGKVMAA